MKNFIRNIKEHKIAALICLGVVALLVLISVLAVRHGSKDSDDGSSSEQASEAEIGEAKRFYEDSDYPLTVTQEGQTLAVSLDGSATPDLAWQSFCTPEGIVTAEFDGEEDGGKVRSVISPEAVGYTTVTYSRSSEIGGMGYDAVSFSLDVYVYADEDNGTMYVRLSGTRQNNSASGAADTDNPYLLDANTVLFPKGIGDWTLTADPDSNAPEGYFNIMQATTDDGLSYFAVVIDSSLEYNEDGSLNFDAITAKLLLKSEALGIEQKLKCVMDEERTLTLVEAEETNE